MKLFTLKNHRNWVKLTEYWVRHASFIIGSNNKYLTFIHCTNARPILNKLKPLQRNHTQITRTLHHKFHAPNSPIIH